MREVIHYKDEKVADQLGNETVVPWQPQKRVRVYCKISHKISNAFRREYLCQVTLSI